jgi:hypothetical protein
VKASLLGGSPALCGCGRLSLSPAAADDDEEEEERGRYQRCGQQDVDSCLDALGQPVPVPEPGEPVAIKIHRTLRSGGLTTEAVAYDDDLTAVTP